MLHIAENLDLRQFFVSSIVDRVDAVASESAVVEAAAAVVVDIAAVESEFAVE